VPPRLGRLEAFDGLEWLRWSIGRACDGGDARYDHLLVRVTFDPSGTVTVRLEDPLTASAGLATLQSCADGLAARMHAATFEPTWQPITLGTTLRR
jgi:hypothetical protein